MISALTGQGINVRHACRVLGVSESGYYDWIHRPDSPRTLRRIWLAGEVADVHKASGGTYGEMRVTAELRHGRGIIVGHNAVGSIMRELGLKGLPTRRLPKGARVAKVASLDLVCREFRRDAPNELWMTDYCRVKPCAPSLSRSRGAGRSATQGPFASQAHARGPGRVGAASAHEPALHRRV